MPSDCSRYPSNVLFSFRFPPSKTPSPLPPFSPSLHPFLSSLPLLRRYQGNRRSFGAVPTAAEVSGGEPLLHCHLIAPNNLLLSPPFPPSFPSSPGPPLPHSPSPQVSREAPQQCRPRCTRYQGKRGGSAVLTAAGNQALSPPPPSVPPPAPLSPPSPKQSLSLSLAAATPAEAETEAEAEAVGGGGKLRAAIARLNARSGQRESSGNFTAGAAGAAAAATAAAEVSSPSVPFNNITFNNITFNNVTLNNAPLNKPLSKGGMKHGCHRWPCSARPGLCGVMHRPIRVYLIWFGPFSRAQKNILRSFIRSISDRGDPENTGGCGGGWRGGREVDYVRVGGAEEGSPQLEGHQPPRLVGHQPSVPRLQGPPGFLLRDAQRRVIIPVRPSLLPPPGFPPPDFRRPDFPPPIFQPPIFQPPGYPAFG
ncbi:unnamed protein product [Closterium sp. NIES-65]|nr:unnamed protein product [Closterium sp. NIES-65]